MEVGGPAPWVSLGPRNMGIRPWPTGNGEEYYLLMDRVSTNVLTTLVLPIIFFNLLVNLVYWLPIDSGERVGYSVTLVLTFAVLTMQVNSLFPPSGEMPIMGKNWPSYLLCNRWLPSSGLADHSYS